MITRSEPDSLTGFISVDLQQDNSNFELKGIVMFTRVIIAPPRNRRQQSSKRVGQVITIICLYRANSIHCKRKFYLEEQYVHGLQLIRLGEHGVVRKRFIQYDYNK